LLMPRPVTAYQEIRIRTLFLLCITLMDILH
jgi:hypothetical protein